MAGNQIMIQNGAGIISIPIEHQKRFREMLIDFYETDNMKKIKEFLYQNCIDGMEFFRAEEKMSETEDIDS